MPIIPGSMPPRVHDYPQELVSFIFNLWQDPLFAEGLGAEGINPAVQLPDRAVLEQVISTCYQASLLREEERPVMFRLIICPPELFPADAGPPSGLQRLQFERMRQFNAYELQRLGPAADFPEP